MRQNSVQKKGVLKRDHLGTTPLNGLRSYGLSSFLFILKLTYVGTAYVDAGPRFEICLCQPNDEIKKTINKGKLFKGCLHLHSEITGFISLMKQPCFTRLSKSIIRRYQGLLPSKLHGEYLNAAKTIGACFKLSQNMLQCVINKEGVLQI